MKVASTGDPALDEVERRAKTLKWEQVTEALAPLSDDQMLRMLDSSSVRVGDTASYFLGHRKRYQRIIEALMRDEVRTAPGRLRAINTLALRGASLPESIPALMKLLDDRSDGVINTALWNLVFFRYRPALSVILERLNSAKGRRRSYLEKAKQALEADDPFIYSPHAARDQATRLWKLDQEPCWESSSSDQRGNADVTRES